jgi:TRAP-type C4-dicarboxylate transport system substrate-binding protein
MGFMMKKKFESLSPQARDILLKTSGEAMSRKQGAVFDWLTTEAIATYKADPKQKFLEISAAAHAKWAQDSAAFEADWVKQSLAATRCWQSSRSC